MSESRLAMAAALLPPLLGAVSLMTVAHLEPPARATEVRRFEIPPGTGERAAAGEAVDDVLPRRVNTAVGMPLQVVNQDTVRHIFGPFVLHPGQSWTREFATAGDYAFDCSLYPVAGFTIAVEPSPQQAAASLSRGVHVFWTLATALVVASLAGTLAIASTVGATTTATTRALIAGLPGLLAVSGTAGLLAASRLASWRAVLLGGMTIPLAIALILGGAAALLAMRLLPPDQRATPERTLPPLLVALVALGALVLSPLGLLDAGRLMLAALGGGLLVAAFIAYLRRQENAPVRLLAITGCATFLAAMPLPFNSYTPPIHGILALPALAVGVALLYGGGRAAAARWPDGGWNARVAGAAVVIFATSITWWALIRHLDAVTLPVWGNPVAPSTSSIERGATQWTAECSACHSDPTALPDLSDRALLELITSGHAGARGLAYRLDLQARGDLVNYLRWIADGQPALDESASR